MKKIATFILGMMLLLVGCASDEDYIDTVKNMSFSNGQTIEQYVNDSIKFGEMYQLNKDNFCLDKKLLFMMSLEANQDVKRFLRQANVVLPEDIKPATWIVEGKTKDGKILIASNDNIKIKIETRKNGDYIETGSDKITTFDKKTNRIISEEELELASALHEIAMRCGYTNVQKEEAVESETKRFDEKEVLKNSDYTIKYYPDGRVKYFSDGIMFDLDFEDRSYLKDINESLDWLDKEMVKYNDEGINTLVDLSIEIEYQIISEKLNKKITDKDREEIKKLESKATKIFKKLQNKVESISQ
ncbi:hypothetical protein [Fusobacterium sp.]|uniref:hypothetical protein n=1 Tax=Fusobacterium sp. TaxID=68766 RepID=UPI00262641E4|nr:hypothetical protein [Fusobacterium sp.]